jgi:hypothetical protein
MGGLGLRRRAGLQNLVPIEAKCHETRFFSECFRACE